MNAVLKRSMFETSRALEYFSEKELRAQIGHGLEYWPAAILRELIDNALDACEAADVVPEITIRTADDCLVITDNGPGLPPEAITKSLDYSIRVSNKAYYVSPTRGQMGNALKVVWAAPFVATGAGCVEIESQGKCHRIEIGVDRIAQIPQIRHTIETSVVKPGTEVKIRWDDLTTSLRQPKRDSYNRPPTAAELVAGFAAFNPQATFSLDGQRTARTSAVMQWKWSPNQPTSAHWYNAETLRDLIAAYIARERDGAPQRTVREFVAEFRGLSATAKQKVVTEGWSGKRLHDFVVNDDVDTKFVTELLTRMQAASSAPPPTSLGTVGRDHLTAWMSARDVAPQSIRYRRKVGIGDLPFIFEIAFGINNDDHSTRRIVTGLNWSPVIGGDPDSTLRTAIAESRLDHNDPVTLLVHIARPRFQFADPGKTRVTLNDDIQAAITAATKNVTKAWKQAKRQADRTDRVAATRLQRLRHAPPRVTIREVAFEVMEDAYNKASAHGKYYANARQIMYAARPAILDQCDASEFNDVYFTQTLLKDYLEEYQPDWKVVWDARGHLLEPHTCKSVSLGGLAVKTYMDAWHGAITLEAPAINSRINTAGPESRYSQVLFIEKEGFQEILTDAGIDARYDMAIMSTKGLPVKAACDLIRALHEKNVRIFVLRDFDLAGFKIVRTLRNGTRLSEGSPVIDLGLRFEDIKGLTPEPCAYSQFIDPRVYLRCDCHATKEEQSFLVSGGSHNHWSGQRVEINAMTSDQLIAWLERKFKQHAVKKLVPSSATLKEAFRRAVFLKRMQARIETLGAELKQKEVRVPARLGSQVCALLEKHPAMSWDDAAWQLAKNFNEPEVLP